MKLDEIIMATNNSNKLSEIKQIVGGILNFISLSEAGITRTVIEDGAEFEENAVKKAVEIMKLSGMPCLADDSGIVVEALDGRPGVYSARYACGSLDENASDEQNNFKLLGEMSGVLNRSAKYVCVLALAVPGEDCVTFTGECCGLISDKLCGTGGFGYDPLFYVEEYGKTMAQLSTDEKNRISHRRAAINKLLIYLGRSL